MIVNVEVCAATAWARRRAVPVCLTHEPLVLGKVVNAECDQRAAVEARPTRVS